MSESDRHGEFQLEPEQLPPNPEIYKNINKLCADIDLCRSYGSLIVNFHTYVENEYGLNGQSASEVFEAGYDHVFFPSEQMYESNREAANDLMQIFMYEYLAKTYEESHSVKESTVWMRQFFRRLTKSTTDRHSPAGCKQPPRESYRQCDNAPCPVNYIKADLSKEAEDFAELCAQDGNIFVDERYTKIIRRALLANEHGIIEPSDYSRMVVELTTQYGRVTHSSQHPMTLLKGVDELKELIED